MSDSKNIFGAILDVMKDIGYVQKDGRMRGQDYTYASEAAFLQALRPLLLEHGIVVVPVANDLRLDRYEGKKSDVTMATASRTFIFHHVPSDTEVFVDAIGQGSDFGDKAVGKALTYALKYALRQTFLIETGDDPDHTSSEEYETPPKPSNKAVQPPANVKVDMEATIKKFDLMSKIPNKDMTEDEIGGWLNVIKGELELGHSVSAGVLAADERYYKYITDKENKK